ncbi:MAG TPA: ATP-binding protein [Candidatus Saccharimonadales bacterium]|nr:ATP-binding protein [Candidatus Saccharimonadales bacterium]
MGLADVEAGLVMLGFGKRVPKPSNSRAGSDAFDERKRFEVLINNIADGMVMIDSQQVVQLINPAAAAILGWYVNEATGLNIKNVMKLVDAKGQPLSEADNPFNKILKQHETLRENNAYLINRENKQLTISLAMTPLMSGQEVTAAVATFRDVSEERAAEKQRADFISTASHEMRTPVAAIEGYLALALNDKVATIDNRARDYLEKAHESTQHLGQLFQDLLTSAKAEDGRLTSHPAPLELGDFLEKLTTDLRFSAEKKGLEMEFVVGSSNVIDASQNAGGEKTVRPLYYVYVDPDRLREVITNLFDNAVKYTPEGKVSIGLTGNDQVVQCYVKDTGPGIPAEDVPHLFQKFYRVDNSATRTIGGTGLGLFICRKIIELYSGRIWVESELGKGSTFYINLPRLSTEKAAQLQAEAAQNTVAKPINSLATS